VDDLARPGRGRCDSPAGDDLRVHGEPVARSRRRGRADAGRRPATDCTEHERGDDRERGLPSPVEPQHRHFDFASVPLKTTFVLQDAPGAGDVRVFGWQFQETRMSWFAANLMPVTK